MSEQTITTAAFRLQLDNGLYIRGEVKTAGEGASRPAVLVSHGFRGHKDWAFWPETTDRLAAEGFYTVSFDYSRVAAREAGASEALIAEASTLSRELEELKIVANALRVGELPLAEQADASRLGLIGHSRAGGGAILHAAEQGGVRALVVWNGGSSPARAGGEGGRTLLEAALDDDQARHADRFVIENRLNEVRAEVLIVQGGADRESLLAQNRIFKQNAPHFQFHDIERADHTFNAVHPYAGTTPELEEALAVTIGFLRSRLEP
ncbi:dienelactone hydrolase family protein [Cohnella ginsengisoli]|uniref:Dienelactone hydrolase family protein n=1 Tax=Cohnella ginsengisoli TaxID=425004 RepID=A0A9X4KJE6_9BACL|nr:dienelactone hydrolase family protein [Cohnella ginsengisoli]MDG0793045.1 dienelactone hydrolase family protein [Cohnella ginsengisoli]